MSHVPSLSSCESALKLLEVVLSRDVILAAATALWRGNKDCTHPSSDGHLDEEKRRIGEEVDRAGRGNFEEEEVADPSMEAEFLRRLDLMADLRDETDALLTSLLHFEAI